MAAEIPDEVEELIAGEPLVAFLGTCHDGLPHTAPLWYRYEDGVVEIMTTGRKLANVRQNSRVSLAIQTDEGGHPEWMVTLRGTATVVEDEDVQREANRRLNEKYGADADDWQENDLVRIDVGSAFYKTFD